MNRCEFCKTRLPRDSERCDDCGAGNPNHNQVPFSATTTTTSSSRVPVFGQLKERYPKHWPLLAGVLGTGIGLFVSGLGLSLVSEAGVLLILVGFFMAGAGIALFFSVESRRKLMNSLGVDAASREAFERERPGRQTKQFHHGTVVVTENWLRHERWLGPVLLPLQEVRRIEEECVSDRGISVYGLRLRFKDYQCYKLPSGFNGQVDLVAVLTERCPNARK